MDHIFVMFYGSLQRSFFWRMIHVRINCQNAKIVFFRFEFIAPTKLFLPLQYVGGILPTYVSSSFGQFLVHSIQYAPPKWFQYFSIIFSNVRFRSVLRSTNGITVPHSPIGCNFTCGWFLFFFGFHNVMCTENCPKAAMNPFLIWNRFVIRMRVFYNHCRIFVHSIGFSNWWCLDGALG